MERHELARKVGLYLERARRDDLVENHPMNRIGYWRVIGEAGGGVGNRLGPIGDVLHGKFIDAVAYAVQQPGFYDADLCSRDDSGNCNNGRVEKIKIRELKDYGLAKAAKSFLSVYSRGL